RLRSVVPMGGLPMHAFVRVGVAAALSLAFCVSLVISAASAEKPYTRDDLADAAIRLEAEIKTDAGTVTKPVAALKRDADAASARNDARGQMQLLTQIAAVAPTDTANWLRLSRTILQLKSSDDRERTTLRERAATAAYIAYQRTTSRNE